MSVRGIERIRPAVVEFIGPIPNKIFISIATISFWTMQNFYI